MAETISITGPVEKRNGKYILEIPLEVGGDVLARSAKGIGRIEGSSLVVVIQDWLAGMLRIEEGDLVHVDNADGKFNIQPVAPRSE